MATTQSKTSEKKSKAAKPKNIPAQKQARQPGHQKEMKPEPESIRPDYIGSGKLKGKVALISGGDSGIGRAVALHFAREGADVAIMYLNESDDANDTVAGLAAEGVEALALMGDCGDKAFCQDAVSRVVRKFGRLDILVNNAAEQHVQNDLADISEAQLIKTFTTNIFGYFFLTQAALPHLKAGAAIINTGSVTSFKGNDHLIDYASTKGAIQAFTFSLAKSLGEKQIRVNEVAPGPIWTPLIPATFSPDHVKKFGKETLMGRPGQPSEVAPAYVFLASADASYMTGQVMHINGGGHFGL
jgi:NAD(P)-dependent dehydrogenase (short-subunit alcohol dehydrogenase family)